MDQSHDGTQPLEPVDTTQVVPAGEPEAATAFDAAGAAEAEQPAAPASPATRAETTTPADQDRAAPAEARSTPADQGRYAAPVTTAAPAPTPERPRGPHAAAILLGVLAIAVATLTILRETTDLTVNWSAFGPVSVIAAGVLLLLIGVVGLARRER